MTSSSPVAPFSWRACLAAAALALAVAPAAAGDQRSEQGVSPAYVVAQSTAAASAASQSSPQQPAHPAAEETPATPVVGESQVPQAAHAGGPAGQAHKGEGHESGSPWGLVGKIFNFALLVGSLWYLLRSPAAAYLATRAKAIRADLANAEETRASAASHLEQIEARMRALPAEIEAMLERGKREIADEEARIRDAAVVERQRMLEQARREIELQVRAAERMLRRRAGELAVTVASERVRRRITVEDQARLVDRYLENVGGSEQTI